MRATSQEGDLSTENGWLAVRRCTHINMVPGTMACPPTGLVTQRSLDKEIDHGAPPGNFGLRAGLCSNPGGLADVFRGGKRLNFCQVNS
mmetsp:Transcript_76872/g.135738  ORF Transcript_76872/g.135738 Transcript_76872/m.135738 type:complete len:89 (+) Transcript_76872:289-555(+)